ncbi:unnamed protein product, partial [Prorocentrum cordatum]
RLQRPRGAAEGPGDACGRRTGDGRRGGRLAGAPLRSGLLAAHRAAALRALARERGAGGGQQPGASAARAGLPADMAQRPRTAQRFHERRHRPFLRAAGLGRALRLLPDHERLFPDHVRDLGLRGHRHIRCPVFLPAQRPERSTVFLRGRRQCVHYVHAGQRLDVGELRHTGVDGHQGVGDPGQGPARLEEPVRLGRGRAAAERRRRRLRPAHHAAARAAAAPRAAAARQGGRVLLGLPGLRAAAGQLV